MSDSLSSLNEEDVRQLARLIESLENSTFDFLQLSVGDMKVTIGKGAVPPPAGGAPVAPAYTPAPQPAQAAMPAAMAAVAATPPRTAAKPVGPAPAGTVDIKSPIMGMFYAQSEPGAPPFVAVGAEVREDTTVALVEVMKTFNAIPAGVRGTIVEVCAENAQLVEFGQVLFRVKPS